MRSVEISARTRQEAIQQALSELGAELHEVEIEILDEGSKGLFGLGARPVRVRVSCEQPAGGRGSRDRRGDGDRGPRRRDAPQETPRNAAPERRARPERPPRPEASGERLARPERYEKPQRPERGVRGGAPAQSGAAGGRPQRAGAAARPAERRSAPADRPARAERPPRPEPQDSPARAPEQAAPQAPKPAPKPVEPIDEARAQEAAALLEQVVRLMGMEGSVVSEPVPGEGTVILKVSTTDSAMLIGRKGRTLNALQYLVNRMVHRDDSDADRVVVDIEGYLERRRATLEDMARRVAERVERSGRRTRLKPLSPQERRIVHVALQDHPGVRTFSVGSDVMRCVVIAPASETPRPQSDNGSGEDQPPRRPGASRRGRGGRGGRRRPPRRPNANQPAQDSGGGEGSREPDDA